MAPAMAIAERRTSADVVFDYLHDEISALRLLPGAKISETEVASHFDVSRQPVRDAFSRLANLDLVLVRPQRATVVKGFSSKTISTARFVRAAVEMEVIRMATKVWDGSMDTKLRRILDQQERAIARADGDGFHDLDYQFHKMLCDAAQADFAFDVISQNKAIVDRLCLLSLMQPSRMQPLLDDHRKIVEFISTGDAESAVETVRYHLTRLDSTIEAIRLKNAEYFED